MMKYWAHDSIKEVDVINGCFWAVRRKAIEDVGFLDEDFFMYGEDMDWCKRFSNAGWKIVYLPLAEALHFGGASSSRSPIRFYIEMQKANLRFWGKHYGAASRKVYFVIILIHQSLRALGYSIYYVLSSQARDVSSYKMKRSIAAILGLLGKQG
jgi:GT2 family glycosyltransferase